MAGLIGHAIGAIATDTARGSDDGWIVDATPVEGGRSNQTLKGSALAGWACSGRGASPARRFWGCGCTWSAPGTARPVAVAPAGAKPADREVLLDLLTVEPQMVAARPGQLLLADKHDHGREVEDVLAGLGVRLLRPARTGEAERAGARLFRPLRQLVESVNQTFKGQLDLEQHGGHTPGGVWGRDLPRTLA